MHVILLFVGNLYPYIFTIFCRFILIFLQMSLILPRGPIVFTLSSFEYSPRKWKCSVPSFRKFYVVACPSVKYCKHSITVWFLSRISILTRNIDIGILSVRPSVRLSVRNAPVLDENGLTYPDSFFPPYGSPIILVLSASNIFTKFRRGHPLRGR